MAIEHGQCADRWLELIFQAIVNDALKRKTVAVKRKGRGSGIFSRSLTTIVGGLLCGLANHMTDSLKTLAVVAPCSAKCIGAGSHEPPSSRSAV
jgi:hypothetical protein